MTVKNVFGIVGVVLVVTGWVIYYVLSFVR
jgi:uncharacterized protein YjeT (DUF2065 family)